MHPSLNSPFSRLRSHHLTAAYRLRGLAAIGLLAMLLPLSACSPRGATPGHIYAESHALVVASTQYQAWPAQAQAQVDMELVATALEAQNFKVHKLLNPSFATLITELKRFGADYGQARDNRLLIYIAGYGVTHVSPAGRAKGSLALVDTPPDKAAPPPAPHPSGLVALTDTPAEEMSWGKEWPKAIGLKELDDWAKKLATKHVMVVLNSCFNGSVFNGQGDYPDALPDIIPAPVRHYLIAGDGFQCGAAPTQFASTFAEVINSRASDLNNDGYTTASEISSRVQALVSDRSLGQLNPRSGKSTESHFAQGEMLFDKPVRAKTKETPEGQ